MLHSTRRPSEPRVPNRHAMASYDTLTMNSAPNDILRLSAPDSGRMITMDAFDHDLNFEGDGLLYVPYSPMYISIEENQIYLSKTNPC
jgi:hypothetical protein